MIIREAAIHVLREAGEPLMVQELVKRILDKKLWRSGGKTPAASIEAVLIVDMKKKGDLSTFVRVAPQNPGDSHLSRGQSSGYWHSRSCSID